MYSTCPFCDLKDARPCGECRFEDSHDPCTREAGHDGVHIHCRRGERYTHHEWYSWARSEAEKDKIIARRTKALRAILIESDYDSWLTERCFEGLGLTPEPADNTCHVCHGSGGGPDAALICTTCKGAGEVTT